MTCNCELNTQLGIGLLLGLSAAVFATDATAQCEPAWDTTLGNPGISDGYISEMLEWDDGTGSKFFAAGSAENIGGGAANDYIAQYDPITGNWSRLGGGLQTGGTNVFISKLLVWDDGNGEKLYVTGQFGSAGGDTDANSFATWDGSSWSDVGAGFTQTAIRTTYDMLPLDLGDGEKLYLAGNWEEIGGVTARGLATFDGTDFEVWGTGAGLSGFSPFVQALQRWDGGGVDAVYACGRFTSLDGVSTRNVARYNIANGEWESFGQSLIPDNSTVNHTSWALFDDGTGEALYVAGGRFRIAGDSQVYLVAKWDGTTWTGVGQTLSGRATDLAVWDDGSGPALYATGTAMFEVNYFAKLDGNIWVPAAGGGVNNPPVNGNFASAFGLYVWGNDLVVGGNFTQVGGFDDITGAGMGKSIPAVGMAALQPCTSETPITDITVITGNLLGGDITEVSSSDDTYYAVNSVFGFLSSEPNLLRVRVNAMTSVVSPTDFDLTIETRTNNPSGTMTVSARNYDTNAMNVIAAGINITVSDAMYDVVDVAADPYINDIDGSIEIEFKQVVIATFSLSGFQSRTDLVQFDVN